MSRSKDNNLAPPVTEALWSDRWVPAAFLLFLSSLGVAAPFLLFRRGNGKVLLIAFVSGGLLWALEHLEIRYTNGSTRAWNPLPGYLAPGVTISLVTLAVCLPTLNIYFLSDDFGFVHLFRTASLSQLLRLFHTEVSQGIWGASYQELRPLYGFFYMLNYYLWGLHPVGYHLTGILQHILNSWMVFLIAKRIAPGGSWRAAFAGLLFAVLPIHSQTVSWITGLLTEPSSTFLYLAAFLCFLWYRATGLSKYLVMSTIAFALGLLSKEYAVTLPVMLVSYDVFRKAAGENEGTVVGGQTGSNPWRRFILPYVPFASLLLSYLMLRRLVFMSFLNEDLWWGRNPAREAFSGLPGFLYPLAGLGMRFARLHAFNIRQLLLPFPALALGLVLGLYLVWAFSLLWRRSECRRSIVIMVYFGLGWYLISSAPLLVPAFSSRHLYLPAVGPCIAAAFLTAPACGELRMRAGYVRLLSAVLLISISASQLWKDNAPWARWGEMAARGRSQLATALETMPQQTLVIVWLPGSSSNPYPYPWFWTFPFLLQEPFSPTDLYSRARIIELPNLYCCPGLPWWEKTKRVLTTEMAGAAEEEIEIHLLAWDGNKNSLEDQKRVLSRLSLRIYITKLLGGPVETVKPVEGDSGNQLVEGLAKLVSDAN